VIALPDTQYYASSHPEILDAQIEWILRRRNAERIAFVVHEGDIVDADEPRQWETAARSLHRLDGAVPYVLTVGNHDYRRVGRYIGRATSVDDYFPVAGFSAAAGVTGTFEPGRLENSFEVFDVRGGGQWLVLSLEFGPRDAVLAWAGEAADRYAAFPTIVVTHAYLHSDGTRYDHLSRSNQLWNPHEYLAADHPGGVNDGEEIWRKLVEKHRNIALVLCGHDLGDGVARLTSVRPGGGVVHQLLANYQMGPLGGEGFLWVMRFFPEERKLAVQTYSPYTGRFKADPENEFQLGY
jgi:Calcineurin-like phosphoesterase